MRRIGNSKKLKVIIPWLLSGMSFCPDSHRWRTRRMLLCFCLREIEATGLRAAGRWGINSLSLFPSAMQLSCAVRTGSYDKVLPSLLHPYPPHALHITAVMTDTSVSSFAILPSSLPPRWTSATSWVENKMKNYWRHNYTTFKMCLHSHPCSNWLPALLKPRRVVHEDSHIQEIHKPPRKSWWYSCIINWGTVLKTGLNSSTT